MKYTKTLLSLLLSIALLLPISATHVAEVNEASPLIQETLTQEMLTTITEDSPLTLTADQASITISSATAEGFLFGEEIVFTLSLGSVDDLTGDQWEQVGDSALYHFDVTCDGTTLLGWGGQGVSIALPYVLTQGEVNGWQLSTQLGHNYALETSYDQEANIATLLVNESGYFCIDTNPFTDITVDTEGYTAILWAEKNDVVNGVGNGLFAPEASCTRAMIATVLWRMSGEGDWGICYPYADVEADWWYTDPIYWCTVNGIVNGYDDETFRPDQAITREQLVAMVYRYAQYLELDVSVGENTNILSYTDVFDVSEYAISAFQWACGAGLVEGDATALYPQREATRSELVTMLMRLAAL